MRIRVTKIFHFTIITILFFIAFTAQTSLVQANTCEGDYSTTCAVYYEATGICESDNCELGSAGGIGPMVCTVKSGLSGQVTGSCSEFDNNEDTCSFFDQFGCEFNAGSQDENDDDTLSGNDDDEDGGDVFSSQDTLQNILNYPIVFEQQNVQEYGFLTRFTRSCGTFCTSGSSKARSETVQIQTDVPDELNFWYEHGRRERSIDPPKSMDSTNRIFPRGAVASWNEGEPAPYMGTVHKRNNRNNAPYKGLASMQPPTCPLLVSNMPSFSEGGSDFCLCNERVISTDEEVLCVQDSFEYVCNDLDTCGNDLIGGFWDMAFTGSGDHVGIAGKSSNSVEYWTVPEKQLFSFSNQDYSISDHPESGAAYAAQQSFSTWLYASNVKEGVKLKVDVRGREAVKLSKVNLEGGAWDALNTVVETGSISGFYDSGSWGTRFHPQDGTFDIERGWYFLSIHFVMSDKTNPRYIDLELVDLEGNRLNAEDVFDIVNVNGPMQILPSNFDDLEQAEVYCEEQTPYWSGDFSKDAIGSQQNWDGLSANERNAYCCGSHGMDDVGMPNPNAELQESCVYTNEGFEWSEGLVACRDDNNEEIPGTHWNAELGMCCGGSDFDITAQTCEGQIFCGELGMSACQSDNYEGVCQWQSLPGSGGGGSDSDPPQIDEDDQGNGQEGIGGGVLQGNNGNVSLGFITGFATSLGFGQTTTGLVSDEETFSSGICVQADNPQFTCEDLDTDVCTDYTGCSLGTETGEEEDNLGYVGAENDPNKWRYACFNNRPNDGEGHGFDWQVGLPDNQYMWRDAGRDNLVVMLADETFYVNNQTRWYTCNDGSDYALNLGETTPKLNDTDKGILSQAICYETNNVNTFKECCAGPNCQNEGNALKNHEARFTDEFYTTPGGNVHELLLLDGEVQSLGMLNPQIGVIQDDEHVLRQGTDFYSANWQGFESLQIQLQYNPDLNSDITIIDAEGSQASFNMQEYSTNKLSEAEAGRVWYKINLPINDMSIDTENVEEIRFGFRNEGSQTGYELRLGNLALEKEQNNFCGSQGEWINDLDIDEEACEGNPAYGWTGTRCCGSNTRYDNIGETYFDNDDALQPRDQVMCGQGKVIKHDQLITPQVLWFEGETIGCGQERTLQISTDAQNANPTTTDTHVDLLEAVGTNYRCGIDGNWVKGFDEQRASLLAITLNEIGQEHDEYHLFCGPEQVVSTSGQNLNAQSDHICSLSIGDRNPDYSSLNTATGAVLLGQENGYEIEAFLDQLTNRHEVIEGLDHSCGEVNPESGFEACVNFGGGGYEMYYDDEFGLFVSSLDVNVGEKTFWQNIGSWFSNLFNLFDETDNIQIDNIADQRNIFVSQLQDKIVVAYFDEDEQVITLDYRNIPLEEIETHIEIYKDLDFEMIQEASEDESYYFTQLDTSSFSGQEDELYKNWKALTSVLRLQE